MSNVVFDYSALSDAKSYAKKVVTGWGCMDSYKDGIKGKLSSPLDEWRLSGEEPYGRGYVSSAQQCITNKQNDLQGKRQQWIDLSDNLGKFLQYLKDTDDNVVTISNLDDMGSSSIEIVRESQEATYKATTFEKTVDIADGKKTITKTLTLDKASMSTEYGSVVASNGVVTQEVAAYSNHASASRTVIDYTTASSSAKSVAAAKAASDSNLKKGLTFVKNTASKISDTSTYLKADDDTQRNITIYNLVKKNYFVSQVDKYIIKYDPNKEKVYAFGDLGKKTEKTWTEGKKSWDLLIAN